MRRSEKSRSDKYQWLIIETSCTPDFLASFDNSQSIQGRLNPFHYDETLLDLKDQLKREVWKLAQSILTDIQWKILKLKVADGYTQVEIAKILGCNQSSVTKSLNGNVDTSINKRYGGTMKKLKKAVLSYQPILDILKQIQEIQTDRDEMFMQNEVRSSSSMPLKPVQSQQIAQTGQPDAKILTFKKSKRKQGTGSLYWDKETKKWRVKTKGCKHLGRYKTRQEAEMALNQYNDL